MSGIAYRELLVGNQIVRRKRWNEQPSYFDSDRHRELYDVICESNPTLNVPISGRLLREWLDRTRISEIVDAGMLEAYRRERLIDGVPAPLAPEDVIPALWPPGLAGSYGCFHWKSSAWAIAQEITQREIGLEKA